MRIYHAVLKDLVFDGTSMATSMRRTQTPAAWSPRGNDLDHLSARSDFLANMTGFEFHCGIGQDDCGHSSLDVSLVGADLEERRVSHGLEVGLGFQRRHCREHAGQLLPVHLAPRRRIQADSPRALKLDARSRQLFPPSLSRHPPAYALRLPNCGSLAGDG